MNKRILILMSVCLCFAVACSSGGQGGAKGVTYTIHRQSGGEKAKINDFITLHLQYATEKDSLIFSSYAKSKPLSFKFQETLFKGVLNEGLKQMAGGDSATFLVPADTIFGERLPRFLKAGDKIKYTVSLIKVQSQAEYQKEKADIRGTQLGKDKQIIEDYLKEKGINNAKQEPSELYSQIKSEGTGQKPSTDTKKATLKYTLSVLGNDTPIEKYDKATEVDLLTMPRGMRESLWLLKKGGKGTFYIPAPLGYSDRQHGSIPPNSVLVYDVELIDFQ